MRRALARALAAAALAAGLVLANAAAAQSIEVLAERTADAWLTAFAKLDHAPFPLAYNAALDPAPLFSARDPRTGEGVRVVAKNRYLEGRT